MDIGIILATAVPLCAFLYGAYRILKKDSEVRRDKVVNQVEQCISESATTKETIRALHKRIDSVEHSQEKLEHSVENKMDRLHDKLDKIMDILLDRSGK